MVGKYVLIILKTTQFCNCEICTNQACSRHVVDLSAITDICSVTGSVCVCVCVCVCVGGWVGGFQDFRTKFVLRSYFRTRLHTDRRNSEVFHDIYAKTGQSRLFFRYLQLNQGDVASVRLVFQQARFGHFLSRNKCQALIKQ